MPETPGMVMVMPRQGQQVGRKNQRKGGMRRKVHYRPRGKAETTLRNVWPINDGIVMPLAGHDHSFIGFFYQPIAPGGA